MIDTQSSGLQLRLINCLQTIIDLEETLSSIELGQSLINEFKTLKSLMEKIKGMEVYEGEVQRVEQATARFLKELKEPLQSIVEKNRHWSKFQ